MKCPDIGIIQAFIDSEVDLDLKKDIEAHIAICEKCNNIYKELKTTDDLVFDKINKYKKYMNENVITGNKAFKSVKTYAKPANTVFNPLLKYKKYIAAACLALVLLTCISVQPLRAAISDALSIFRVENIKGIKITLSDIEEIKRELQSKTPNINLKNFGEIKAVGGQEKIVSQAEADNSSQFKIKYPEVLKSSSPVINLVAPATLSFKLNVNNVNEILKTFGANKLIPAETDGKTFSADFGKIVNLDYKSGNNIYKITELTSPELIAPEGVNVDELYASVVDLPILPEDLKSRLKAITDWKKAIYIPVIDTKMETVILNGKEAYIYSNENLRNNEINSWIVYMEDGVIYGIQSNTNKEDIIKVAQSMR